MVVYDLAFNKKMDAASNPKKRKIEENDIKENGNIYQVRYFFHRLIVLETG